MHPALIPSAELIEEGASFGVLAVGDDDREEIDFAGHDLTHRAETDPFILWVRVENDEDSWHARVNLGECEEVVGDAAARRWEEIAQAIREAAAVEEEEQ